MQKNNRSRKLSDLKIIGIGSPFGADAIGWILLDQLQQQLTQAGLLEQEKLSICFAKHDRPGPALLEYLQGSHCVILLDALASEQTAGSVIELSLAQLLQQEGLCSSHGFGIAETLALGNVLGILPAELILLGIAMGAAGIQQNHNLIAKQALPQIEQRIMAIVSQKLKPDFPER